MLTGLVGHVDGTGGREFLITPVQYRHSNGVVTWPVIGIRYTISRLWQSPCVAKRPIDGVHISGRFVNEKANLKFCRDGPDGSRWCHAGAKIYSFQVEGFAA